MPLAYLVSQYPGISHTFIRREVAALRAQGVPVSTFSVRPVEDAHLSPDIEEEARSTFTILSRRWTEFVGAQLQLLFTKPRRYFATVGLALRHRAPGLRAVFLSGAHFAEACVLALEIRRQGIDHLHVHFANSAATVGLLAARLAGIRWSFVMHGPSETDYPAGYLLADKIQRADMVICVSWFAHSQAMRTVPFTEWKKFRLVHCGLDLSSMPKSGQARQIDTIICVGRLCSDKAQAGLIVAFEQIRKKFPDARLQLVGDGADRARLEALTESLNLKEHVEFLGPLPESETLRRISEAGLMVLPSFWEGLPVVLMEAMALKVPVITSRIAGVPEMIRDGENGLLFTPARWTELARCIERLLGDPALGRALAEKAQETIRGEFAVEESARRLTKYFGELAGRNPI